MTMNYLGTKLRELRESKGLLLRQIAAQIDVDTALLSKIERGERKAKREQVQKLAVLLEADKEELLTLWLSGQIHELLKNEPLGPKALQMVLSKKSPN